MGRSREGHVGPGGRAGGGTGELGRLAAADLVEVLVRDAVGLGGIAVRSLVEAAWQPFLGDPFLFPKAEFDAGLGLGRSPRWMVEWG